MTRAGVAEQAARQRESRARTGDVYGLVVHTTGSGIVDQAIARGREPLEHAVEYYLKPDSFYPQYVGGWDGRCVQIADELDRAQHVGFAERPRYLSGEWERTLPDAALIAWRRAWPAFPNPARLFPGASPNDAYAGLELLPIAPGRAEPAFPGASFTLAQHQLVVLLARDMAERWHWPVGWPAGPRLLGHEDLNPLSRSDKGGGWDPGALRARPRFAWRWVRELAAGRDPGPIGP